jgi:hypothetical protein
MTNAPSKIPTPLIWTWGILLVICLIIMSTGYAMSGGPLVVPTPTAALAGAQPISAPTNEKNQKRGTKLCIVGCVSVIILLFISHVVNSQSSSKPLNREQVAAVYAARAAGG